MANIFQELQLLAFAVRLNRVGSYCNVASFALFCYDYALTVKYEVTLVWGAPWTIGKLFFLLTRYSPCVDMMVLSYYTFGPLDSLSPAKCFGLYQTTGWLIFWGGCLAEFILTYRTWAVWGENRILGICLPLFLFVTIAPTGYLTQKGLHAVKFAPVAQIPVANIQSCLLISDSGRSILWDYVIITGFETVILGLTLIKGLQHYRHTKSSLVVTLYRDGIMYYVYLLALSVANVVIIASFEDTTGGTILLLQRVFHSLLTGRILLHLRMALIQDDRRQGTTGPLDLDSIYAYRESEVMGDLTTFAAGEGIRGTDTDISTDVYTDI